MRIGVCGENDDIHARTLTYSHTHSLTFYSTHEKIKARLLLHAKQDCEFALSNCCRCNITIATLLLLLLSYMFEWKLHINPDELNSQSVGLEDS